MRVLSGILLVALLAVAGGCQKIVAPQATETTSSHSYLWPADHTVRLVQTDATTGAQTTHRDMYSADHSLADSSSAAWPTAHFTVTDSSVSIDAAGLAGFMTLPANLHFAVDSTYVQQLHVRALSGGTGDPIIGATDSGGIFSYPDIATMWHPLGLPDVMQIGVLAELNGDIYAATSTGAIWYFGDSGKTWSNFSTMLPGITSMAATNIQGVHSAFAIAGGVVYQLIPANSPQIVRSTFGSAITATSLYFDPPSVDPSSGSLYIGTSTGDVWQWNGTNAVSTSLFGSIASPVVAITASPKNFYAAFQTGDVYLQGRNTSSWLSVTRLPAPAISVAFDLTHDALLITTGASGLYQYNDISGESQLSADPIAAIVVDRLTMVAIWTDGTEHSSHDGGATWSAASNGLQQTKSITYNHSFTLLHDPLTVGASWPAAQFVNDASGTMTQLTARVLNHYDRYNHGQYSFDNVLLVRYATEVNGDVDFAKQPYYWMIYYASGVGPVELDEYDGTALVRQWVVVSK